MGDKPQKLTGKQAAFVDHYLSDARFNATEAARMAGYAGNVITLRAVASDNLAKPPIAAAIHERLTERAMAADEVLARLAEQARGDIQDVITIVPGGVDRDRWVRDLVSALKDSRLLQSETVDEALATLENARQAAMNRVTALLADEPTEPGWRVDLEKAMRLGVSHLIRKIGYDQKGRPSLEIYDSQAALVQIGRHHALFVDRSEVTGPVEIVVRAIDYRELLAPLAPLPEDAEIPTEG